MSVLGIDVHRHCIPKRFIEAVRGKSGAYGAELVKAKGDEILFHTNGTQTKLRKNMIDVLGQERLKKYYLKNFIGNPLETTVAFASLLFGGVMDRSPRLQFCFAHGGGQAPYLIGRWTHGHQMRSEAKTIKEVPEFYFKKSYFDTVIFDSRTLRFLIELVGSEHVVVGTDWPADMGTNQPLDNIRNIPLSCLDRERILRGNVADLLKKE